MTQLFYLDNLEDPGQRGHGVLETDDEGDAETVLLVLLGLGDRLQDEDVIVSKLLISHFCDIIFLMKTYT